ncbi:MAG TPA: DNA repair protein RecO [Bacteroidales bacterium]|nr:DNA repair protein RecO [Bacteroidales bacterium]
MLHRTRAIVLKTIKYSETSVIAHMFTEAFGLRSYIIKGVFGKKKNGTRTLLQSLSLLDLVVYEKPRAGLQNIKEISIAQPYTNISFDVHKGAILMFLNEIIYKSIGEQEPDEDMFRFIYNQLVTLDETTSGIADFHLTFIIRFTKYLGFLPRNTYSDRNTYFDMQEGEFVSLPPLHTNFMNPYYSRQLNMLLQESSQKIFENASMRNALLEKIIIYYSLHVPAFGEVKSLPVLHQLLNNKA